VASITPRGAYTQINLFLARAFPHLYFLSKHLRVIYDDTMDYMAITNGKEIYLTKKWFMLPYQARIAVFLHELYHVLMKHPLRTAAIAKQLKVDPIVVNIAADAKANYAILQSLRTKLTDVDAYVKFLQTFGVPTELLEKASVEEIVKWMLQNANRQKSSSPTAGQDLESPDDGSSQQQQQGEGDGDGMSDSTGATTSAAGKDEMQAGATSGKSKQQEVLNEGSKDLIEASAEQFEAKLTKVIRDSLLSAKIAGAKLSSIEERILDELVKSKVDWRSLLKSYITNYMNNLVIQSYMRLNRRFADLPGAQPMSRPKAWVFVDVSGSISSEEFTQFMSEVTKLSSFVSETIVVTWDVGSTGEYRFKGKLNANKLRSISFRGGGGTQFEPVLQKYAKSMKPDDIMIVLTDGVWFDVSESYKLLKKLKCFKILVTTCDTVPGFDKVVEIESS